MKVRCSACGAVLEAIEATAIGDPTAIVRYLPRHGQSRREAMWWEPKSWCGRAYARVEDREIIEEG
jgi:hypothetical protein